MGVAECFYPHPQGWRLEGDKPGATLEHMTVKRLTAHYRMRRETVPKAIAAWMGKYPGVYPGCKWAAFLSA